MYEEREYLIFNVSELDKINFNEVMETSTQTVRKSVDETKTFVKWNSEAPSCVDTLTTSEGPYSHEEILLILATPEWTTDQEQP